MKQLTDFTRGTRVFYQRLKPCHGKKPMTEGFPVTIMNGLGRSIQVKDDRNIYMTVGRGSLWEMP